VPDPAPLPPSTPAKRPTESYAPRSHKRQRLPEPEHEPEHEPESESLTEPVARKPPVRASVPPFATSSSGPKTPSVHRHKKTPPTQPQSPAPDRPPTPPSAHWVLTPPPHDPSPPEPSSGFYRTPTSAEQRLPSPSLGGDIEPPELQYPALDVPMVEAGRGTPVRLYADGGVGEAWADDEPPGTPNPYKGDECRGG
jgi:hypothetical protein